ncbi:hypothetical protein GLUCOINTEAF2_0202155 [Komagataeibacter intermedius AF2]|uniref:Uncharacterized protein n=4 Tax=Komagataeibacter intermedius TaxID=66229 RepID=A0A0N1FLM0_9PROT|nr:hypothetical protein GLUCOINTEAF2_0202155 [Komagataeibacter intermedius AF2]GBQ79087.1 hypothetical protein AA0521_3348 [Komagataeibacter intermedius NRIC 0521]
MGAGTGAATAPPHVASPAAATAILCAAAHAHGPVLRAAPAATAAHDAAAARVVGGNPDVAASFFIHTHPREDRVPAVPMTRQPRPGAIRRLLPVMVALVLPLGACARGKFGEDFCISCASEKQAASTGPAAGTPATGAAARPPGAPTSTQATSGTRHL